MRKQLDFDSLAVLLVLAPKTLVEWSWEMLETSFPVEFIPFPLAYVRASVAVFDLPKSFDEIFLPLAFVSTHQQTNERFNLNF